MRWTLSCLLACLAGACTEGREMPAPLGAPSDAEARALVERFFSAYVASDADAAVELLCERDAASRGRASSFIRSSQTEGSPFRIETFEVRSVAPSWDGDEPIFHVTVAYPRNSRAGEIEQPVRVRAKDGCIEHFFGRAKPPVPAPSSRPAPPTEAPVAEGDEIIEL